MTHSQTFKNHSKHLINYQEYHFRTDQLDLTLFRKLSKSKISVIQQSWKLSNFDKIWIHSQTFNKHSKQLNNYPQYHFETQISLTSMIWDCLESGQNLKFYFQNVSNFDKISTESNKLKNHSKQLNSNQKYHFETQNSLTI